MRMLLIITISLAGGFLLQLWSLPRVGLQSLDFGEYLVAWLIIVGTTFLIQLVPVVFNKREGEL